MEGLATRWTIQTAWACFELTCRLALGLNLADPKQLPPRFWEKLNRKLGERRLARIDHTRPPWDDLHVIQEERNPLAHLGAGGGRFPPKADANLAAEEAEKAIRRFLTMAGKTVPTWITITGLLGLALATPSGAISEAARVLEYCGSLTVPGALESDPATLRVAIVRLDGRESCDLYPAGFDWKPRVEQILEGLGAPIKGIRVYDSTKVYLDSSWQ
jgi:hypothetical protein